jgi:hypothetical protein
MRGVAVVVLMDQHHKLVLAVQVVVEGAVLSYLLAQQQPRQIAAGAGAAPVVMVFLELQAVQVL